MCPTCSCPEPRPTRRGFLGALAALVGLLLTPARALAKKLAIRLDQAPQLKSVGGSVVLSIKGQDILFARDSPSTVRAFAAHCTHKKTVVKWVQGARQIHCPGHGSRFDAEGRVLKGPATKPLPVYAAVVDAAKNRIILTMD